MTATQSFQFRQTHAIDPAPGYAGRGICAQINSAVARWAMDQEQPRSRKITFGKGRKK